MHDLNSEGAGLFNTLDVYSTTVNNRPGGLITSPGVGFCAPGTGFCDPGGDSLVLVDIVACHCVFITTKPPPGPQKPVPGPPGPSRDSLLPPPRTIIDPVTVFFC